jgi:hypothetical protein
MFQTWHAVVGAHVMKVSVKNIDESDCRSSEQQRPCDRRVYRAHEVPDDLLEQIAATEPPPEAVLVELELLRLDTLEIGHGR